MLLLTARQKAGETVLRCVWRLTARGYRWNGAALTRFGQKLSEGIAWLALGDLVVAEAPTARTRPTAPDLSMSVYGKLDASPVTAEVVSASIATTPAGEVPVMLRPWIKATVPVTLYPSRSVGSDYFGADCLLAPAGDHAALDAEPGPVGAPRRLSRVERLPPRRSRRVRCRGGPQPAEGAAFARWVISSEILTFGVYNAAYECWERSLTCTMTAAKAVLMYTRMNGAALGLECGCGRRHRGWPWERTTVWDDEERRYRSFGEVDMDRAGGLIAARG
ncbi:hypothetical protein EJ357_47515 [Streptomyces cyaneochromogenes]|uniref:Uncharacterized protein n=1 Tax=Streptomyces cyaneochromogenes TaxID=2496836 RepID=A0A3Q9F0V2_9ACTN|nr:hypothetical protein [Streptomyces cyaneochromogenes]AZQ32136.1 hypothetical protein EJ357_00415 [Streptomyces cyaneochromogenes]AZQ40087.1 hypothetical protein EJ357_47515 [Streptomyces cyaneochromogenes]